MAESVECAECGTRYDSQENPFCPRCGSTRHGAAPGAVPAATASSARAHPRRRRLQAGGVILVAVGGLTFLAFLFMAAVAGRFVDRLDEVMVDQQGGDVDVRVLQAGAPLADATVRLVHPDGRVLDENRTDADGRARVSAAGSAFANVSVTDANATWNRTVLTLPGQEASVTLDLATDAPTARRWVGARQVETVMRWFAAVLAAGTLVVVAGGVAALRVRNRGLALTGAVLGVLPALLLFVASPSVGLFLLLALMGTALWLVVQGRHAFPAAGAAERGPGRARRPPLGPP